ncbi:MAG: hypothetical protein QF464_20055, partial [Myxococcota bacterium]|nr:hypothetical protein [Myxococcota bacterium]
MTLAFGGEVDTTVLAQLGPAGSYVSTSASGLAGVFGEAAIPTVNGGNLTQEWVINFNPLLISILAAFFGYLTGKVRSLTAIIVGIAISVVAIYAIGLSMSGWWLFAAIAGFSIGEMTASPTKMRYLASIAPPGREGQYMGYVNMTVGIGWSIGSIVAGELYEKGGDKVNLAKKYLVEHGGVAAEKVEALSKDAVLPLFEKTLGVDAWKTREMLWETYEPYSMWAIFAAIGIGSMLLLIAYNAVVQAAEKNPSHTFNTHGVQWVRRALIPICLVFWYLVSGRYATANLLLIFGAVLATSLVLLQGSGRGGLRALIMGLFVCCLAGAFYELEHAGKLELGGILVAGLVTSFIYGNGTFRLAPMLVALWLVASIAVFESDSRSDLALVVQAILFSVLLVYSLLPADTDEGDEVPAEPVEAP